MLNRAGYLLYLIERAKKCIDFSATLYIIHLVICTCYGGWPSSFTWWIVNIAGLALMALLGEYLCIRHELREIPISRFGRSKMSVMYICLPTDADNFFLCLLSKLWSPFWVYIVSFKLISKHVQNGSYEVWALCLSCELILCC